MTLQRIDNIGIVVSDLDAAVAFFTELGMELEGTGRVEGPVPDLCVGLEGVRCDIAMMRTPDGHARLELAKYVSPDPIDAGQAERTHNTLGMHRVMFAVDDIDDVIERMRPHGAEVVGGVARYEDAYRLCYLRGPDGIFIGLAQQLD
ncbi:MAG TPA: VOC family protein [Phytomonospora sp.]